MCGIGGYVCMDDRRPRPEEVQDIWTALHSRGTDAAGIAWRTEGGVIGVVKNAGRAEALFGDVAPFNEEEPMPPMMIWHTRLATQGTVADNRNNHPVYDEKDGLAIVHNGIISNADDVMQTGRRDGEVDSEAIVRVMASASAAWKPKVEAVGNTLTGSYAVLGLHKRLPGMVAFRHGHSSPLELGLDPENGIVWLASVGSAWKDIQAQSWHGFILKEARRIYDMSLENERAFILTPGQGLTESFHFKAREASFQGPSASPAYRNGVPSRWEIECPRCFKIVYRTTCEAEGGKCPLCKGDVASALEVKALLLEGGYGE